MSAADVPPHMRGIPEATQRAIREAAKRVAAEAPELSPETKAALAILLRRPAPTDRERAA